MKKNLSSELRSDARFITKEARILFNILHQWIMVSGLTAVQTARFLAIVRCHNHQTKMATKGKPWNNPINKKGGHYE